ncbi:unnamed protein product [Urochloa humidicola]
MMQQGRGPADLLSSSREQPLGFHRMCMCWVSGWPSTLELIIVQRSRWNSTCLHAHKVLDSMPEHMNSPSWQRLENSQFSPTG